MRGGAKSADAPALGGVIFDMDGVITRTAELHASAWKTVFDDFLHRRAREDGTAFVPFDAGADYRAYVDGKPREAGVRGFLNARDIELPEGDEADPSGAATVHGLARQKDSAFEHGLLAHGVQVYASSIVLVEALRAAGVKTAVVTSSRHGRDVLERAGIDTLFDARLDGLDLLERGLPGKPAPDAFLACAADLALTPASCVVVEDAASGVAAARAGEFGLVVGVDRGGNRRALEQRGADLVVEDLDELNVAKLDQAYRAARDRAAWRIEQEGFDPARERGVESLFTVANGHLGVRGALDTPVTVSQDDLFVAGVYDGKQAGLPYSEHEFMSPGRSDDPHSEIVSLPFPFRLRIVVGGQPLSLELAPWTTHRRQLDMRSAVLHAEARYEVKPGRFVTVRSRRCASQADPHLLLQEVSVVLENHTAPVELDAGLEDPNLSSAHPHLVARGTDGALELQRFSTRSSGIDVCLAQRALLDGAAAEGTSWHVPGVIGQTLVLRRWVAVYSSREADDPLKAAAQALAEVQWPDFEAAVDAHVEAWARIWPRADVRVSGSPGTEQALRFHAYQLTSAADHDPTVSVGGRALTGRAYEGHVFWDVEVFMLPFYLHTRPTVARALLGYRHHTLDGARRRARELGYRGACYAWESTVTGDDVTPTMIVLRTTRKEIPIFTGTQQIHVTADVAYGVWRYWEATSDAGFLAEQGVEILVETARFWVSRCVLDGGAYHLREVVGPDEYHHGANDNAYTNWMARFNLEKAVWAVDWLAKRDPGARAAFAERLALDPAEVEAWAAVAHGLYFPEPDERGVIEQFEGFFDLGDYSLAAEERFRAPVDRLFDWAEINRLKLIKQADVLMLPFLFPRRFSRRTLEANYRYYEPLTDHASSLSPGVHAALAARLGLTEQAERYWRQSLTLDLSNVMGNSMLGVHPACMGATWQALVFHMLGVRFGEAGPVVDEDAASRLPERWQGVNLSLQWRGRQHEVEVTR